MKFPITPLTLPITIHCQPTPPAFLQLGGQGLLTATAVPTQVGLGCRCERKTGDVWGGRFAHCRDRGFRKVKEQKKHVKKTYFYKQKLLDSWLNSVIFPLRRYSLPVERGLNQSIIFQSDKMDPTDYRHQASKNESHGSAPTKNLMRNQQQNFGMNPNQRGLPTLKWDNAVSREIFKFSRGTMMGAGDNDTLDSLNANYRVTISPLRNNENKNGLVSIVSADTHIQLNDDGFNRPPTEGGSLSYSSSEDKKMDPRALLASKKKVSGDRKAQLMDTMNEIRDNTTELWLKKRKVFPEFRWTVKQKRALRKWFDQLDNDNSGEVDVQELADPLLSTGIAKTMIEVVDLIREVDRDDTGEIGFEEFLQIMKPTEANKSKKKRDAEKRSRKKMGVMRPKSQMPPPQPIQQQEQQQEQQQQNNRHENPIKKLEKIQKNNGDIDLKVVVAMQRRKFLLDAIVGEMSRREEALNDLGELHAEKRHMKGKAKFRLLHDIRTKQKEIDKSFVAKQAFIKSMKTMVDRNKDIVKGKQKALIDTYDIERKNANGTSLSLTEAIDDYSKKFDLAALKTNQANRIKLKKLEKGGGGNGGEGVADHGAKRNRKNDAAFKLPVVVGSDGRAMIRGIVSRGAARNFVEEGSNWYRESTLKVSGEATIENKRRTDMLRKRHKRMTQIEKGEKNGGLRQRGRKRGGVLKNY